MANQYRWNGAPVTAALLEALAADVGAVAQPGTARFNFTVNAVIIRHFLGDDWFRDHLLPDAHPDSYLRPNFAVDKVDPKYSVQILELAEMLFNLQGVSGFAGCLEHMALRQIQSGLAELQIGRVLKTRGVPFRYVEKGETTTVDLVLQLPSGERALGEVKCKYDEAVYSDGTLRHALAAARKQIGKGNAGIVFVKVPTAWVTLTQDHARERPTITVPPAILAAARSAMQTSSRIKKVVFYLSHYAYAEDWGLSATHTTLEMQSPRNPEGSPWNVELLGDDDAGLWQSLPDLLSRLN